MMDWYIWEMNRRYTERLTEVRSNAEAARAASELDGSASVTDVLLAGLGCRLVAWGMRLQSRHEQALRG